MSFGSSDPPPPPDYAGISENQADASAKLASQQTYANRPRQVTPWGSVDWGVETVWDEANQQNVPYWSQELNLTPDSRAALDAQFATTKGKSELSESMINRLQNEIGPAMNWDQFGEQQGLEYDPSQIRQQASDAAYESATSRLDPRFEQSDEQIEAKLRNRGLRAGDQQYDAEMGNYQRSKEDAYGQAERQSFLAGQGEAGQLFGQQERTADYANQLRQSQITEEMTKRGFSLNEINALLSGQQVGTPQMSSFRGANVGETPDMLGAAGMGYDASMNNYNAGQMQNQGFMSGLTDVASMGAGFFGA